MEEKENLHTLKIINPNMKIKKKLRFKNNKASIIALISVTTIVHIFLIMLLIENRNLNKEVNRLSYFMEKTISINFFKQNYTSKFLFDGRDDYSDIINKNIIHVSYSLDDKEVYPTFVSMLSGLENCNKDNIIVYHLLLSYKFNSSNIEIFESLKEKYQVKINYYIIPNIFGSSPKWTDGTDCVYYKILIPFMFPDYERMIYLDGDTLIRKDILEMFKCPFNDTYILGFPFYMGYVMEAYGIKKPEHYINGGCLLFNIKKIRHDYKDLDLFSATLKNKTKWGFREQDAINYVFYPNIGFLPLKFGIYMIGSSKYFNILSHYVYSPLNLTEGAEAVKDPSIVHFSCCWPKVWTNGTKNLFNDKDICLRYQKEFYFYANKSKYYKIINDTFFFKKKK